MMIHSTTSSALTCGLPCTPAARRAPARLPQPAGRFARVRGHAAGHARRREAPPGSRRPGTARASLPRLARSGATPPPPDAGAGVPGRAKGGGELQHHHSPLAGIAKAVIREIRAVVAVKVKGVDEGTLKTVQV